MLKCAPARVLDDIPLQTQRAEEAILREALKDNWVSHLIRAALTELDRDGIRASVGKTAYKTINSSLLLKLTSGIGQSGFTSHSSLTVDAISSEKMNSSWNWGFPFSLHLKLFYLWTTWKLFIFLCLNLSPADTLVSVCLVVVCIPMKTSSFDLD